MHATSLHFVCRSCLLWPIFSLLENMVGLKVVIQMSGHNLFFFCDEIESNYQSSDDEEVPFARHSPTIEANPSDIST